MKVGELKQGMALKLAWPWVGVLRGRQLTDTNWLVFLEAPIVLLTLDSALPTSATIIYLGHDFEVRSGWTSRQLIRRVLVDGTVAKVRGHDFKFLEPHPEFIN